MHISPIHFAGYQSSCHDQKLRLSYQVAASDTAESLHQHDSDTLQSTLTTFISTFNPSNSVLQSSPISAQLDTAFQSIYRMQQSNVALSPPQIAAVKALYQTLKNDRHADNSELPIQHDIVGKWHRPYRYAYTQSASGDIYVSGLRHIHSPDQATAITSYLKDVLSYDSTRSRHSVSPMVHIKPADHTGAHQINDTQTSHLTLDTLIEFVHTHHPRPTDTQSFQPVLPRDRQMGISFFIRRMSNDPTAFIDSMIHNTESPDEIPEIRPGTAVAQLRDTDGQPITDCTGTPVGIGLLGDVYPFKKGKSLCPWSEQGEFIFDNTTHMITAQKCDIYSGPIPIKMKDHTVDVEAFQTEMEARESRYLTHIEGKWLTPSTLYQKMVNQGKKAVGKRPMGSSQKTEGGRKIGVPKNKYSNYVSTFNQFGVVPHNEAFLIHTLSSGFRIGINTHSKQAIRNSLLLYHNTIQYLNQKGYYDLANQITLAIYNNQSGEVLSILPSQLHELYSFAPEIYSSDHACIHPDMTKAP